MTHHPVRIQLSRRAGFDLQETSKAINGLPAVNVSRSSKWGNPFVVGAAVDVKQAKRWGWWPLGNPDYVAIDNTAAVKRFSIVLAMDHAIHAHVRKELSGRNLACFCGPDESCHADALLRFANPVCEELTP